MQRRRSGRYRTKHSRPQGIGAARIGSRYGKHHASSPGARLWCWKVPKRTFGVDGRKGTSGEFSRRSVEVVNPHSRPVLTKILEIVGVQLVTLEGITLVVGY